MVFVEGGFVDEYSFDAKEQIEFAAKYGLAISVRWVSLDGEATLAKMRGLSKDDFNAKLPALMDSGSLKHITALSGTEFDDYQGLLEENKVSVLDIGSGVGKDKLGAPGFRSTLDQKIDSTITAAQKLGTRRIRMFNFYPTDEKNNPMDYGKAWDQALAETSTIAGLFKRANLVGFLENETSLLGDTGAALYQFWRLLNSDNMLMYFDGANLVRLDPGKTDLAYRSWETMEGDNFKPGGVGGLHLKDARYHKLEKGQDVEHAPFPHFVLGQGNSGYKRIFKAIRDRGLASTMEQRLVKAGLTSQIALIYEPHRIYQSNVGGITQHHYPGAIDAARAIFKAYGLNVSKFQSEK